jgi:spoIIIJ-associated protein
MDYSEKWGKDVEEAVKLALLEIKLSEDEVDIIVLEESSKGFFGLGSKLAKVRVEKKKTQSEPKEDKKALQSKPSEIREVIKPEKQVEKRSDKKENREEREPRKENKEEREPKKENREERDTQKRRRTEKRESERPDNLVETTDHPAVLFIHTLAEKMDLSLEIKAMKNDDSLYIDIEGKDSGTIIGKRGQTLDSIQYLTSLVANKEKDSYLRVVVDAENYRNKRESTLEQLAERLAGKVIRTKKTVRLEPMNPYERKVIHAKLQDNGKVVTRSEGEEPYRRVVIELK